MCNWKQFWEGKRVFITGHTGFKGSWLSLWLQQLGAKVVGVSLDPPTTPSVYQQAKVADGMVSLRGDIRDGFLINQLFQQYKPEIVFHLAAQPLVRYSYREPLETYATNVMGTLNILEAIRATNTVRSAVMVTTDKCYENREWEWGYRENEPMGGHDPYSSSKGCAELLIASYRKSYFSVDTYTQHQTAVASVRAGNVIGGGDWAEDRVVPDIVRAFVQRTPVKIRSPHAIRPWQYVLDPLYGYLMLSEKLYQNGIVFAEGWNFGPYEQDAKSVEWLVQRMGEKWGKSASWKIDEGDHPHEANYLKLDCSKARSRLGWKPRWDLSQALDEIVEWHKAEQASKDMREITVMQIDKYCRSID